jgi:hypothetical protein
MYATILGLEPGALLRRSASRVSENGNTEPFSPFIEFLWCPYALDSEKNPIPWMDKREHRVCSVSWPRRSTAFSQNCMITGTAGTIVLLSTPPGPVRSLFESRKPLRVPSLVSDAVVHYIHTTAIGPAGGRGRLVSSFQHV